MPPFLRVCLLRHGQSSNNVLLEDHGVEQFAAQRVADAPLSSLGAAQARATGAWLAATGLDVPLSAIYTSPMSRALHTASLVGDALSLPPFVWADLHEVGGCYDLTSEGKLKGNPGMGAAAIRDQFPSAVVETASGVGDKGWWMHSGAELPHAAHERVWRVLAALRQRAARLSGAAEGAGMPPPAPRLSLPRSSPGFVAELLRSLHIGPHEPGPIVDLSDTPRHLLSVRRPPVASSQNGLAALVALPAAAAASSGVRARAEEPRSAHAPECIVLVCHGDLIEWLLRACLGISPPPAAGGSDAHAAAAHSAREGRAGGEPPSHHKVSFCIGNCSLTWIDIMPDGDTRVVRINDVRHLGEGGSGAAAAHASISIAAAGLGDAVAAVSVSLVTGTPL